MKTTLQLWVVKVYRDLLKLTVGGDWNNNYCPVRYLLVLAWKGYCVSRHRMKDKKARGNPRAFACFFQYLLLLLTLNG